MYNTKELEAFVERVHEEATQAAQQVYDKYSEELVKRIANELHKEDILYHGMGIAGIMRGNMVLDTYDNKFVNLISELLYYDKVRAGFDIENNITKS